MALDHGVLNLPLSKRGNIDRDIDRWKAEQARAAKVAAKAHRVQQITARALVANLPAERLASLAEKAKLTPKQAEKKLRSMAAFEPAKVIATLSPLNLEEKACEAQ